MIELVPQPTGGAGLQLRLRPPRALTARQFRMLFAVLAGAMWLVALASWRVGNAYAPLFALLDSALVGAALRWAWRLGEREEVIALDARSIEVRRSTRAGQVFQAHPYWVRLRVEDEGGRVLLSSSGRVCEVGAFLGPDERRQLARRLREHLAACAGG